MEDRAIKKNVYVFLSVLVILCGCPRAGAEEIIERSKPLLHTFVEIKAWGNQADTANEEAFAEMERVNSFLNNYDPASEISKINRNAGGAAVPVSPETMDALKSSIRFCDMTGGALDLTIGPLLCLWGFGKDKVGLPGKEPDQVAIQKAKASSINKLYN